MKTILLGVTGSIAAVKTPEVVRALREKGHRVLCVMTKNAESFVTPLVLATFSGEPVVSDIFAPDTYKMPHLTLAETADLMLIVPATAAALGRLAHGIADDMVTLTYLTTRAPVLIAPAMHPTLWSHAATQENVKILKARGAQFLGPVHGKMADQTEGEGRLMDPADIVAAALLRIK